MSLGFWADLASVASLIIALFNAYQITTVKRRIVVNLTLGPLIDRLRDNSSEMNRSLSNYVASVDRFDEAVGLCEVHARTAERRLGGRRCRFCKELLRLVATYRREKNDGNAHKVYNALQQVIQEIANLMEEMRIIGP